MALILSILCNLCLLVPYLRKGCRRCHSTPRAATSTGGRVSVAAGTEGGGESILPSPTNIETRAVTARRKPAVLVQSVKLTVIFINNLVLQLSRMGSSISLGGDPNQCGLPCPVQVWPSKCFSFKNMFHSLPSLSSPAPCPSTGGIAAGASPPRPPQLLPPSLTPT